MPRLFIAFELPDPILDALEGAIGGLGKTGADVKWAARDHLHVTMEFLGEVPEGQIQGVEKMLRNACRKGDRFALEVRGLGSFGGRTPRVVWAGMHGLSEESRLQMHRLRGLVHEGAGALGLASDREDFTAHVTLGRVRSPRQAASLVEAIRTGRDAAFGRFRVEELVLFQSRLGREGSVYTRLARAALGPDPNEVPLAADLCPPPFL